MHCRQKRGDRLIEAMLTNAGLVLQNPPEPTHESGTAIDVVLAQESFPIQVAIHGFVGASDHRLVTAVVPASMSVRYAEGLGRVEWASDDAWEGAVFVMSPQLELLAAACEDAERGVLREGRGSIPCPHASHRSIQVQVLGGEAPREIAGALPPQETF